MKKQAFTLIKLLVVTSILAVLAAIAPAQPRAGHPLDANGKEAGHATTPVMSVAARKQAAHVERGAEDPLCRVAGEEK